MSTATDVLISDIIYTIIRAMVALSTVSPVSVSLWTSPAGTKSFSAAVKIKLQKATATTSSPLRLTHPGEQRQRVKLAKTQRCISGILQQGRLNAFSSARELEESKLLGFRRAASIVVSLAWIMTIQFIWLIPVVRKRLSSLEVLRVDQVPSLIWRFLRLMKGLLWPLVRDRNTGPTTEEC